ncbi:MAG: VWA domain-containing protein [Candidatus Delongbacteria bacterium]|nr:VWA domain-containing protein [Candidatus Delongbacteria bacterium]MBN2834596.1 VWA domain-containing protein [Candidatus Delongbacteria bacterium]
MLSLLNPFNPILFKLSIKAIKSFIDNNFREKVIPELGSVVYSDLYGGVEHSGIYIGNNEISNIVVEDFAEGTVRRSSPESFTDKSLINTKIYVSCNKHGAVGDYNVGEGAEGHVGERNFYGLIFSNCHEFSRKCLEYSNQSFSSFNIFDWNDIDETWEPTIRKLKKTARKKIGATKWKLWDWKNDQIVEEPDLNQIINFYENMILNKENIRFLKNQIRESKAYMEEIFDENIPKEGLKLLEVFYSELNKIDNKYEEVKGFLEYTGVNYSFNDLKELKEDFSKILSEMKLNKQIKNIVEKLGREYISEEKKKKSKVVIRKENEVLGIHKSDELARLLPSEYVNLESEELEYLFYSKLLEKSLLTYEIAGRSKERIEFEEENINKKGPVIACLDTSGSMEGEPILKAKALLFSISKILEKEDRKLIIILFGASGQIQEMEFTSNSQNNKILSFLNKGYGGGTDFETPLKRGINIIESEKSNFTKADILMITDGYCDISDIFKKTIKVKKDELDFMVYTVICNNNVVSDDFSDEIVNF